MGQRSIKTYPNTETTRYVYSTMYVYFNDEANSDKCHLAKTCDKGVCKMSPYLSNVKSPKIRNIIAKYRLDVNDTLECK